MSVEAVPIEQGSVSDAVTIYDLRQNILVNLGSGGTLPGGIDVELNNDELDQAIQSALQMMNMYVPMRATVNVSVPAGTTVLPLNHPMLRGVVDATASSARGACVSEAYPDPFNPYPNSYAAGTFSGYGDTPGYALAERQYDRTVDLISSGEFEWTVRESQAGVQSLVMKCRRAAAVEYTYTWAIKQSDDPNVGVGRLTDANYQFVQDYSVAVAKTILGRKLRKYGGGVNMPDGGTETLDGDALVGEGNAAQQQLEDAIKRRRRPVPPERG